MQRKQPLLDTKVLTSWNALLIRAMAHGGKIFGEPRYTQAAEAAADFLMKRHRDASGQLYRTSREGSAAKFEAFLDDYAFLADGLLELGRRDQATEIAGAMEKQFGGPRGGFYFTSTSATDLILRQVVGTDSPLPSGNGVAAKVMLELDRDESAKNTLALFAQGMENNGESMSALVEAAARYVQMHGALEVTAEKPTSQRPASPQDAAGRIVRVNTAWENPQRLIVSLQIQRGFHIQSHNAGDGLIATTLGVPEGASVEYPAGKKTRFAFADDEVQAYDGEGQLVVTFAVTPTSSMRLGLTYQACDESACLPTVTKTIEVPAP